MDVLFDLILFSGTIGFNSMTIPSTRNFHIFLHFQAASRACSLITKNTWKEVGVEYMLPVSPVFHTEVTVSIGLKNMLRVGTCSIPM